MEIDKNLFQNMLLYLPYMDYYSVYQSIISEKQRLKWVDCQTIIVNQDDIKYYVNGKLHREHNLPAVKSFLGTKEWYKNGELHRDGDLPAVESCFGIKEWYKNGYRHRDNNLPAVEYLDGYKKWYMNGKLMYTNDFTWRYN